jgi:hypothetical protein
MALEESGRTSATYYDDVSRIPPLAMGSLHSRLAKANRRCMAVLSGLEALSTLAAATQAQFPGQMIL